MRLALQRGGDVCSVHSDQVILSGPALLPLKPLILLLGDLLVDSDTDVLLPTPCWGNYHLIFQTRSAGRVRSYNVVNDQGFDVEALRAARTVRIETPNPDPLSDPAGQLLVTSNILLTVPGDPEAMRAAGFSEDLCARVTQASASSGSGSRALSMAFWANAMVSSRGR